MFEPYLLPEETVQWEGGPDFTESLRRSRRHLLWLLLALLSGAGLFAAGAYLGASSADRMNVWMLLGIALCIASLIWYGAVSFSRFSPSRRLRRTRYALTDRRILILSGGRLAEYGVEEIRVSRQKLHDGTQILILFDREYDGPDRVGGALTPTVPFHRGADFAGLCLGLESPCMSGALAVLYAVSNPAWLEAQILHVQKTVDRRQKSR